ncbi:hypothetical protein [Frigoribacterium faeni]|nr:hypothetical protein [Frigoribacterium faeni]
MGSEIGVPGVGLGAPVGVFFFKQKTADGIWLAVSWARRCV